VRSAPASVRLVEGEARRFGEIDLIARLGHGGMAEVFLAAPRARPAELVVLKRLKEDLDDSEHRAMFAEEARIMPLLQHPNIVRTTEVGEQLGRQYLALEFLDGLPLDQCSDSVSGLGASARRSTSSGSCSRGCTTRTSCVTPTAAPSSSSIET
jgi:serine/threonine protein kinase